MAWACEMTALEGAAEAMPDRPAVAIAGINAGNVDEVLASGIKAIAVTDHNTISHHAELAAASRRYGIILLPGQEVTTDGGHAGALGDVGWIDFREPPEARMRGPRGIVRSRQSPRRDKSP